MKLDIQSRFKHWSAIAGTALGAAILLGCEAGGGGTAPGPAASPQTQDRPRPSSAAPGESEDYWAIRAVAVEGPDRARVAESHAQLLRKVRGLKSSLIQVIHHPDQSIVYYGRSTRVSDVQTGHPSFIPDLSAELRAIREFVTPGSNQHPFVLAVMDALPPPPSRYAAWDLSTQHEGYWSLQVGAFYNTEGMTQRRRAAEEYCKMLRDQGEKAYFHHGPVVSSVCIGLFPENAIRVYERPHPVTKKLVTVSEFVDPILIELQKKFPNNTENGHLIYQVSHDPGSGQVRQRTAQESFVVKVPNAVEWRPALKPKKNP